MRPTPPNDDLKLCVEKNIKFRITVRQMSGKRWEETGLPPLSLLKAAERVEDLDEPQVCIWAITKTGSGVQYWKSEAPDLYNSSIFELKSLF